MSKDKRYFDENNMPLKEGDVSGVFLLTPTFEDWGKSGCPDQVKWDGDVPRFLNEQEKIDLLIPRCDALRNLITNTNIVEGFEWPPSGGVMFRLTLENQQNYANLWMQSMVSGKVTYPKTIWSGIETFQLQDAKAIDDFYTAGSNHVELCLDQGLLAKQAFRTMSRTELESWISDNSV